VAGIWLHAPHAPQSSDGLRDVRTHCPFCGRDLATLRWLIHAIEASICSQCVEESAELLRGCNVPGWRPWWRFWGQAAHGERITAAPYRDRALTCSFCRLGIAEVPALLGAGPIKICSDCVRLCMAIVREAE
jgi:hypothetical protein